MNAARGIKGDHSADNQFYPVEVSDVITVSGEDVADSDNQNFGPFIQLTFHSTFIDLLQEFYGTIEFVDDGFTAGGLVFNPDQLANDQDTQKKIANILGIEQEHVVDKGLSFVLARYWKYVSTHTATLNVKEEYVDDFKKINGSESSEIIAMFSQYGTHYVSNITEGDFIHQVYVYERSIFEMIDETYPDDPIYRFGYRSGYFREYTKLRRVLPDGEYTGYTEDVGDILAASKDSAFADIEPLLYDHVYEIQSILMFLTSNDIAEETKKMKSVIDFIALNSISNIVYTSDENEIQRDWERMVKGAIFQIFDEGSSPGFETVERDPLLSDYKEFNPDLVTRTATSYTSIVKATFNLGDIDILNEEYVTDLFIIADTLELPTKADIRLPGTTKIYLICRQFLSYSSGNNVPQIVLGSFGSEPSITIIASEFSGVMKVVLQQSKSHMTYVWGSVLVTETEDGEDSVASDSSRELTYPWPSVVPEFYTNSTIDHRTKWIANTFLNGLDLQMITVESVYQLQISSSTELAQKSLKWIINTLAVAKNESKLLTSGLELVLNRALLVDKMNPNPMGPFLLVPILTFSQYQALYESLLETVKLYENKLSEISSEIATHLQTEEIINSQKELNENILKIGQFLVRMVEADSEYLKNVDDIYDTINSKRFRELDKEMINAAKLYEEVLEYNEEVQRVGDELNTEVQEHAQAQIRRTILSVVRGVAGMFLGFYDITHINDDIKGIARVVKKVSYVVSLTEELEKLYDSIKFLSSAVGSINEDLVRLGDLSEFRETFPTYLDWQDFEIDIEYVTSDGYLGCCAGKAREYENVAMKLSARGKAFLNSMEAISAMQYDIIVDEMHNNATKKQIERLKELAASLDVDELTDYQANITNLLELGNILQTKANTVRMELAKTYITMDAALQYDTLKPPTPLGDYNTLSIQTASSKQMADAIYALESFPSSPTDLPNPVVYEVPGVFISHLTSENGYVYNLPLSASLFLDYIRVRIIQIKVTIDSIESAGADGIYIQSNFTGVDFRDRGLDRESRNYNAFKKVYPYVYNYKTGETIVGNKPTEGYAPMTPFGEWIFSIPNITSDTTNVNITYSRPTTTLRIEFYLNIIFFPEPSNIKPFSLNDDACFPNDQTEECLLQTIHQHSVTGDWDAVMVMDIKRTNELFAQKYEHQENHGGLMGDVVTGWGKIFEFGDYYFEGRLNGTVGPPLISFMLNNPDTLRMLMYLTDAIWETRMVDGSTGNVVDSEILHITDPVAMKSFNSISIIKGDVTSQEVIVVDLSSSNLDIDIEEIPHEDAATMRALLEEKMKELSSASYELGTVDFDSAVTPPVLQPRAFHFTTGGFDDTSKLFICILTKRENSRRGRDPSVCEIFILSKDTDPVIPSGYSASLYVSSHLVFSEIIHPSFEDSFGDGSVVSPVLDAAHSSYELTAPGTIDYTERYSIATCSAASPASTVMNIPGQFHLQGYTNGAFRFYIPVESWEIQRIQYWYDVRQGIVCHSFDGFINRQCTIDCDEFIHPTVDSDGLITFPRFSLGNSEISIPKTGNKDKDLAIQIVEDGIRRRISGLSFDVDPISVFVLTNIIFPEAKVVNTTKVYIPGDMLVLGHVVRDYVPIDGSILHHH